MDNTHISTAQDTEIAGNWSKFPPSLSSITLLPARFSLSLLSITFSALRPYAPQIIPVLTCILLVPLAILVSAFAGFVVWRNVGVAWDAPVHLQFGDGEPPYSITPLPKMIAQQRYDISIQLIIPAVESNLALGNFMTSLTLRTPSNKTLASTRQPAIAYQPQASFFRQKPSTISLTVPMFSSFHPGSSQIIAYVEVGRRDSWTSLGNRERRELSVISASVRGSIVHYGIRGLVARFPLTFALLSSATFLAILLFVLAACTLPMALQHAYKTIAKIPVVERGGQSSLSRPSSPENVIKPLHRRRKSRPHSGSSRTGPKAETSGVSISQTSPKSSSFRQRSSRMSDKSTDLEL